MQDTKLEDAIESAHRIGEDIAHVEFIAGREVIDDIALAAELGDAWGNILEEQSRLFVTDYTTTFENADQRSTAALLADHCARRLTHINGGAAELTKALRVEVTRWDEMHRSLWEPYFDLLDRDAHPTR